LPARLTLSKAGRAREGKIIMADGGCQDFAFIFEKAQNATALGIIAEGKYFAHRVTLPLRNKVL
jgi:hypothetical protein